MYRLYYIFIYLSSIVLDKIFVSCILLPVLRNCPELTSYSFTVRVKEALNNEYFLWFLAPSRCCVRGNRHCDLCWLRSEARKRTSGIQHYAGVQHPKGPVLWRHGDQQHRCAVLRCRAGGHQLRQSEGCLVS